MKLKSFRIQNYRNIIDSGWIDIDDIAVIVGKNESGKTSLLKALWKLNPFSSETYNLDREWPRGRRKERSVKKVVVEARFGFSSEELDLLRKIHASAKDIEEVKISKNYEGTCSYSFHPKHPDSQYDGEATATMFHAALSNLEGQFDDASKGKYGDLISIVSKEIKEGGGGPFFTKNSQSIKQRFNDLCPTHFRQHGHAQYRAVQAVSTRIDEFLNELEKSPSRQAVDMAHSWLPTFIYMDDHRIFQGSAQLDQIKQRKDRNQMTDEDETIVLIMKMAGLDLDEEVKKGGESDKEQRMLDMDDASRTLTDEIANRWTQKKYEIKFNADGQHFVTWVKDAEGGALVPLEERSKGFQWFFSFDMTFMHETNGKFENAIILLDEPGLHLHAAAQKDLLERMKKYSESNQLIYTTHLPFMIDFRRLDNVYVAEEKGRDGTKVHKDWLAANEDARFTLQAAMGLSWSQSLFVGQYNLVVEGVDDFWFLTAISNLIEEAGTKGIDPDLVITPAGGASKVAYVSTILNGQGLKVAALLDSDPAGEDACAQLVKQWILNEKNVLMVGKVIGSDPMAIEDLFGEKYYLSKVNEAYKKERGAKEIALDPKTFGKKAIVFRCEDAFEKAKMGSFNKGRVAKLIVKDLAQKQLSALDTETVDKFQKLIAAINETMAKWKKEK